MDTVTSPGSQATVLDELAAEHRAAIADQQIDVAALEDWVLTDDCGALATFRGVVRNHDDGQRVAALTYQAHPQAERFLQRLVAAEATEHQVRVAAVHRQGDLSIGDVALVVSVAAAHRKQAFAACGRIVDLIKAEVPIWKLQHFENHASEWVSACTATANEESRHD
ncbi:molybdenum cofactor biosynthesis protein MoaE [Gordonia sp. C13]|uniref:molybdenum cofactor biosynthesis protein MoaE n=1 Tax=Gordonia sp. C13 TaxID=2935078 RepID=UPI00200A3096|nr:molybdenum cofactor biosynthesis protein MoaE [Gordonia sp. C13]MCK8615314.1 molybdenum cofactor biosynthesis protein MoaE [Gordonia sp. C13]